MRRLRYQALGFVVWHVAKLFLRWRFRAPTGKAVAGATIAVALIAGVVAAKRGLGNGED